MTGTICDHPLQTNKLKTEGDIWNLHDPRVAVSVGQTDGQGQLLNAAI